MTLLPCWAGALARLSVTDNAKAAGRGWCKGGGCIAHMRIYYAKGPTGILRLCRQRERLIAQLDCKQAELVGQ